MMLEPAARVPPARVMMGPVQYAALIVPLVLAKKCDPVAFTQIVDTWREVDVVGYEQGLVIVEPEQEPLMSAAVKVVSQYLLHRARTPDLYIAALRAVGLRDLAQVAIRYLIAGLDVD